jgi:MFS family permease
MSTGMSSLCNHNSERCHGRSLKNLLLTNRLDGFTRYTYQSQATSSFSASAQISTVGVVRAIVAAAAQPAYAKISDYFGRVSILLISCVFYVVGEFPILTCDLDPASSSSSPLPSTPSLHSTSSRSSCS